MLPRHMPPFIHIFCLKHDLSLRHVSLQIHRRSQHFSYRYHIAKTYQAPHHPTPRHVTLLTSSAVPGPIANVMLTSSAKERHASLREMGQIGESLGNLLIPQLFLRRKW